MRFSIGEKVSYLHDSGYGIVKSCRGNFVMVEDISSKFVMEYAENELVKIHGDMKSISKFSAIDAYNITKETTFQTNENHIRKGKEYWEIDLHTHSFMESERGMDSGELLQRQLIEFKTFFQAARQKLIRKLIVIHGVGKGTLKNEIREFLKGQENLEFYDADFREYGKGATEIRMYYKI